jgi:hypothetical protein
MEQAIILTKKAPNTDDEPKPTTDSSTSSPFMNLPPELRLIIYRNALHQPNGIIHISQQTGIPEPPLLLTSKTIRHEALALFYAQNTIRVVVDSYSPATPLFFHKKQLALLAQHNIRLCASQVMLRGPARWRNLLSWLRCAHERAFCPVQFIRIASTLGTEHQYGGRAADYAKEMAVVAGLFRMVHSMGALGPWEQIEGTLGMLRYGLVKYDAAWDVE